MIFIQFHFYLNAICSRLLYIHIYIDIYKKIHQTFVKYTRIIITTHLKSLLPKSEVAYLLTIIESLLLCIHFVHRLIQSVLRYVLIYGGTSWGLMSCSLRPNGVNFWYKKLIYHSEYTILMHTHKFLKYLIILQTTNHLLVINALWVQ